MLYICTLRNYSKQHEIAPQVPSAPQEEAEMLLLLLYSTNQAMF